jgi:BMFP domain-containing protein YqiC
MTHTKRIHLSRRAFLGGVGATISLPLLDAMTPAFAAGSAKPPKRFVAMCAGLGFHAPYLFPKEAGRHYALTPYLDTLQEHRNEFTVISGLSHPEQNGNNGHASEMTWLTSAKRPGLAGFRNTISIDQLIAERIGVQTRFPNLVLSNGGNSMSWTAGGVAIPAQSSPSKLFAQLFIEGTAAAKAAQARQLQRGRSILDTVLDEANRLQRELGHRDREKLDEYLTSVRSLENRLQQSEGWQHKPKPKVEAKPPKDIPDRAEVIGKTKLMYDLIALALQTDSTRTITYALGGLNAPPNIPGVSTDWHQLSHHGRDEAKIAELKLIELAEFMAFNEFLVQLKNKPEQNGSLLDNTMILMGSNLGNASSHSWRNLPLILAGGGFRHGQHIAHDEKNNTPFANLFVQMARQMGVEIDQFGSSEKPDIDGLESA